MIGSKIIPILQKKTLRFESLGSYLRLTASERAKIKYESF